MNRPHLQSSSTYHRFQIVEAARADEIRSNIKLREYLVPRFLLIYSATLAVMVAFGILEAFSLTDLGNRLQWLIGILAGQVSVLTYIARGLFKTQV